VQEGRVIYSTDEPARVAFEGRTRSEYFDYLPTLQAHTRRYLYQVASRGLGSRISPRSNPRRQLAGRLRELARHWIAAQKAALTGMQMMGGYGYSSEYDIERLVRQTLVSTIYSGTSEIQRNIIAKTLGL
jgi:alkylation response protein AidB-like acyl-CoA dehydrogenase